MSTNLKRPSSADVGKSVVKIQRASQVNSDRRRYLKSYGSPRRLSLVNGQDTTKSLEVIPTVIELMAYDERKWIESMQRSGLSDSEILNRISNGRYPSTFKSVQHIDFDGLQTIKHHMKNVNNKGLDPSDMIRMVFGTKVFEASKTKLIKSKSKLLSQMVKVYDCLSTEEREKFAKFAKVRYEVAHEMMCGLYGNPVILNENDFQFAQELFSMATMFDVQSVSKQCKDYLMGRLGKATEEEVVECLTLAMKFNQDDIWRVAVDDLIGKCDSKTLNDVTLDQLAPADLKVIVKALNRNRIDDLTKLAKLREECDSVKRDRLQLMNDIQSVWSEDGISTSSTPSLYRLATNAFEEKAFKSTENLATSSPSHVVSFDYSDFPLPFTQELVEGEENIYGLENQLSCPRGLEAKENLDMSKSHPRKVFKVQNGTVTKMSWNDV